MTFTSRYKAMTLPAKLGSWCFCFIVLYTIFGFFILPPIVKQVCETQLSQTLKRAVTIEKVRVNPYSLSLTLEKFKIMEPAADSFFASFNRLLVNLESMSILKFCPVIREVKLEKPRIHLVRTAPNRYNFSDLMTGSENYEKTSPTKPGSKNPFRLSIANIQITDGSAVLEDIPKNKTHRLKELNLSIPFISNIGTDVNIFVKPNFSVIANGAAVNLNGRSLPFKDSLRTELEINLKEMNLKKYFSYLPIRTNMAVESGTLDLSLAIRFSQSNDSILESSVNGNLVLKNLAVTDKDKNPFFKLDRLGIALEKSSFIKGLVQFESINLISPELTLIRNGKGELNIPAFQPVKGSEPGSTVKKSDPIPFRITAAEIRCQNSTVILKDSLYSGERGPEIFDIVTLPMMVANQVTAKTEKRWINLESLHASGGTFKLNRNKGHQLNIEALFLPKDSKIKEPKETAGEAWEAAVQHIVLDDFSIVGRELSPSGGGDITLSEIRLETKELSTAAGETGTADLRFNINKTGTLALDGELGITPITSDLNVKISNINLAWTQPFITDYLDLVISRGRLSTQGKLKVSAPGTPDFKANFQGNAGISDLMIAEKKEAAELIAWKKLALNRMDIGISPRFAHIDEIILTDPSADVVLDADGNINFQQMIKIKSETERTGNGKKNNSAGKPSGIPISINKIRLDNGALMFSDQRFTPHANTTLSGVKTSVTNLSSNSPEGADIDVTAMVNNHVPVTVKGKINPLKHDLFMDMAVKLKNLDLVPLSPYAGKYAGHKIEKGKLTLNLGYHIDNRKLQSTNKLFLDQFDFGETVKSKDAVKAPVNLAVALLKDPSGRITLNLPVAGSLDDPEFSIAGIVVKMIMNLLAKAATSPFSLLGAMFGSGDDLSTLAFDPGSSLITQQTTGKLNTLIKALKERPGLHLEITGQVNSEVDCPALTLIRFNNRLKAAKLEDLSRKGLQGVPVAEVTLTQEEYKTYLEKLFLEAIIEKPSLDAPGKNRIEPGDVPGSVPSPDPAHPVETSKKLRDAQEKERSLEIMAKTVKQTIEITEDDLRRLARQRARAVTDFILNTGGIGPERLFLVNTQTPSLLKEDGAGNKSAVVLTLK